MPHKFNLPLTYAPKIEGVRNGTIRQTIRTRYERHSYDTCASPATVCPPGVSCPIRRRAT
jgi:hypothetical protein